MLASVKQASLDNGTVSEITMISIGFSAFSILFGVTNKILQRAFLKATAKQVAPAPTKTTKTAAGGENPYEMQKDDNVELAA